MMRFLLGLPFVAMVGGGMPLLSTWLFEVAWPGWVAGAVLGFGFGVWAGSKQNTPTATPANKGNLAGKKWKLWSSIDGGHRWEVIGESDDKDVLISKKTGREHRTGYIAEDLVILPDGEKPCFEEHGGGVPRIR